MVTDPYGASCSDTADGLGPRKKGKAAVDSIAASYDYFTGASVPLGRMSCSLPESPVIVRNPWQSATRGSSARTAAHSAW